MELERQSDNLILLKFQSPGFVYGCAVVQCSHNTISAFVALHNTQVHTRMAFSSLHSSQRLAKNILAAQKIQ